MSLSRIHTGVEVPAIIGIGVWAGMRIEGTCFTSIAFVISNAAQRVRSLFGGVLGNKSVFIDVDCGTIPWNLEHIGLIDSSFETRRLGSWNRTYDWKNRE